MNEKEKFFFNELRHYGEILEDESLEDSTGAWRLTTYRLDGVEYLTLMHNGSLVELC